MCVEMAGVEQDELLIDAVRSYPCIYDIRSPEFKVALVKENAWKAIAETLQRTGEIVLFVLHVSSSILYNYLVEDVRQRWKALRYRYVREAQKQKQPSGSATKTIPPWELLQSMTFLNDFVKHRKLVSLLLLYLLLFSFKK